MRFFFADWNITEKLNVVLKIIKRTREEYTENELVILEENFNLILMGMNKGLDLNKYISPCPIKENAESAMMERLILLANDCSGKYHMIMTDNDRVYNLQNLDDIELAIDTVPLWKVPSGLHIEIRYNEIEYFCFENCKSDRYDLLEFEEHNYLNV